MGARGAYHLVVYPSPTEKRGVIPLFHHPAIGKDENHIRILYRRQSVSHNHHRSVLPVLLKNRLHRLFRFSIQV